ncbi:MAG TPA: DUF3990 domain-containing protein [Gemmataceae bacterium]|nr:DUF3990 domain-containing protein [Gemmataceae bacterium]
MRRAGKTPSGAANKADKKQATHPPGLTLSALHPPPPWVGTALSRYVELWHGCLRSDLKSIRAGIDPTRGDPSTDFGRGFYTSTVRRQARHWAWKRYRDSLAAKRTADRPVVVRFRVPLDGLARLDPLHFVLGDYDEERFWSFVHHCRASTRTAVRTHGHPGRKPPDDWYDVVSGPVAAFWEQRVAMLGSDQFSFHTARAARLLNRVVRSKDPDDFRAFLVRRRKRRNGS